MMDTHRLERAISAFRAALPDFQTFLEPGETFANEELNYKRSLSSGFQPLGEKLLEGAYHVRSKWLSQCLERATH